MGCSKSSYYTLLMCLRLHVYCALLKFNLTLHVKLGDSCGKRISYEKLGVCNRFVPYKFEEIFTKFAKTDENRLTFHELMEMTKAMRNAYDLFGWYVRLSF